MMRWFVLHMDMPLFLVAFSSSNQQSILAVLGASPICLPESTYSGGEDSVVSGWGTTSEGNSSTNDSVDWPEH